jgi:DUF2075 family protein
MGQFNLKSINFNDQSIINDLQNSKDGQNWPVLYLITGKKQVYIGETLNLLNRLLQHRNNHSKNQLSKVTYIADESFNKSVTLDFENRLISYISALNRHGTKLLNNNSGQSHEHDYFDRANYGKLFPNLWDELTNLGLVNKSLKEIDNYNEFKYSPFKTLKDEQFTIVNDIISTINSLKTDEKCTFFIEGGAGTGKSLIAVKLSKIFSQYRKQSGLINSYNPINNDDFIDEIKKLEVSPITFGLVIPMQSFRRTISKVFNSLKNGLSSKQVIPAYTDLFKKNYDIIIVDEAHRLKSGDYLSQEQGQFIKINNQYYKGEKKNQLDWIIDRSRIQIIFYDKSQTVRSSDLNEIEFNKIRNKRNVKLYKLNTQFRIKAGNKFIEYIDKVFSNNPPESRIDFSGYDVKIFDDIVEFKNEIKAKEVLNGLSRIVAGYSWKWTSKKDKNLANDFVIDGTPFIWNRKWFDWINSETSIDEVGCIHTTQGYDLNYVGVIIGKDLKLTNNLIDVDFNNYFDNGSIKGIKNDSLAKKQFILNAYKTMLKRGINGLYLYVVDKELKEYLKKFF